MGYAEVFGNKLIAAMWIEEINLRPWKKYLLESTMEKKVQLCAQCYRYLETVILTPNELIVECPVFRLKNT